MAHQGGRHRADSEDGDVRTRQLHVRLALLFFPPSLASEHQGTDARLVRSFFDPVLWERVRKEFILHFESLETRRA